jgi:hypothetical protein
VDAGQGELAARLMELLGLSADELCQLLDADPLTLLSGQLEHRAELPILVKAAGRGRGGAGSRGPASIGAYRRPQQPPALAGSVVFAVDSLRMLEVAKERGRQHNRADRQRYWSSVEAATPHA